MVMMNISFILSRNFAGPCDERVMQLYRWEPLMVSHHSVKFDGHWHCGGGYTMVLVYHMVLRASQGKSPSCQTWWS